MSYKDRFILQNDKVQNENSGIENLTLSQINNKTHKLKINSQPRQSLADV